MKIVRVGSYKNIPRYNERGINSDTTGYHDPRTGTIYVIKGKTPKSDIEHEVFHSKKRHPDRPRNPIDYVRHELEADLYAYRRTGNPKHIKRTLGGIFYVIHQELYEVDKRSALSIIRSVLYSLGVPNAWKEDYNKLHEVVIGK